VRDLAIGVERAGGDLPLVRGAGFDIAAGECLGLVGESGSGKSLTCMALGGLLPRGVRVTGGTIRFDGVELVGAGQRRLRETRGRRIGFVFQDPTTALDPLFTVGSQITEVMRTHLGRSAGDARRAALDSMDELEIPRARERFGAYPHELSGGMKQRVAIAIALAGQPLLLVADEPTTALDVTTERAILDLLDRLRRERGLALLLVTHSLPVAAAMADRLCVMYAGEVVESGDAAGCLAVPAHPYTEALAASARSLEEARDGHLLGIPGTVPSQVTDPDRCVFAARCRYATHECHTGHPPSRPTAGGWAACWHTERDRAVVPS
jgi:oligopeptide/dipeptide ABC transporter ATP-binding protein